MYVCTCMYVNICTLQYICMLHLCVNIPSLSDGDIPVKLLIALCNLIHVFISGLLICSHCCNITLQQLSDMHGSYS